MPALRSLVLDEMPSPDWADVVLEPLPDGAPTDPEVWARAIFDIRSAPRVVVALMALRQLLVPLIGVTPGKQSVFDVQRVSGEEALIRADDRHLDFCAAVGVDPVRRTVRVTTAVRLHGWRGRLYFAPVSVLHDPITRSMMRSAARRLSAP
jgi:hypothetical protein